MDGLQKTIKVEVDFYDDEQKQKLLQYPSAEKQKEVSGKIIEIPTEEFLTYYLFHKRRPGKDRYRNYNQLGRQIHQAYYALEGFIKFDGESMHVPSDVGRQVKEITEHIGESIGLSVVNRIHGLTEADWDRLDELPGINGNKTFDFQIASDGKNIIQIETKGCCLENNEVKTSAVSHQKNSILEKKERIRGSQILGAYKYPANLRYGTVTMIGYGSDSSARCLLLDPDPEMLDTPPAVLRLLNRMSFLRDWISFISPRSQLATAISTRLADLHAVSDPISLNGVPLRKGDGDKLVIQSAHSWPYEQSGSAFFSNKSQVSDGQASGVLLPASFSELIFLGVQNEFVIMASKQDFSEIINSKYSVGTVTKTINCLVTEKRFRSLELPIRIQEKAEKAGGYYTFELSGDMHYTQEGLVFGLLPLA